MQILGNDGDVFIEGILPPLDALASPCEGSWQHLGWMRFPLLLPTAIGQLLDVVHHAVQVPLRVDLLAPAQVQP